MVLSSFGFASGAVLQHLSIKAEQVLGAAQTLTLRQLRGQLQQPRWLLGLLFIALGAGLHVSALFLAPVTVVQPIGVLAVPLSVLLASRIHGYRISGPVWLAASVTVAGLVSFTVLSTHFSNDESEGIDALLTLVTIGICCFIAGALFAASRRVSPAFRSLALASGGAVLFGLTSALLKSLFVWLKFDGRAATPPVALLCLGIVGTAVVGGWVVQQAHAVGHPEVVVGALTTIDPVVAVVFGLVVLREGVHANAVATTAMTACGAVALLGVAALARHHPEARRGRPLLGALSGRK